MICNVLAAGALSGPPTPAALASALAFVTRKLVLKSWQVCTTCFVIFSLKPFQTTPNVFYFYQTSPKPITPIYSANIYYKSTTTLICATSFLLLLPTHFQYIFTSYILINQPPPSLHEFHANLLFHEKLIF